MKENLITSLTVVKGRRIGKIYKLNKKSVSIGLARSNTITIRGNYVSDEHAVLEKRDDGVWVLSNKSLNNTFVNQTMVDHRPLADGDIIQIGSDSLFKFSAKLPKGKEKKTQKNKFSKKGAMPGYLKNPFVIIALLVYLGGIIGGVVFLSDKTSANKAQLTTAKRDALISKTEVYLDQMIASLNEKQGNGSEILPQQHSDLSANYFKLLSLDKQAMDADKKEVIKQSLLSEASLILRQAWHLESSNRANEAIKMYERINDLIPDLRVPVSLYSYQKIKHLKKI